jgi:DNA-binding NarL/FixJ family response regulator
LKVAPLAARRLIQLSGLYKNFPLEFKTMPDQTSHHHPIRILLADDHPIVRFGLRQALQSNGDMLVVAETERGDAVGTLIERYNVDVVVLNVRMSGLNGIEVAQRVKASGTTVKILILTSRDDDETIRGALHAGADGYLLKTSTLEQIVQAIQNVAAGRSALSPEVASKWKIFSTRSSPPDLLSPRELEVLNLAGKGYTNKAIALLLKISNRTVQTHLTRVYYKLDVASRTEAVMRAIAYGWIAAPDFYEI